MLKPGQLQGHVLPVVHPLTVSLPDQRRRAGPVLLYSDQQRPVEVAVQVERETHLDR